ncbi:MAG: hypothetical protein NW701_10755 [Nitrospira sp.]
MMPSSPDTTPFRITFFFGPDGVGQDEAWRCVFNVKKRSWKGGVHISVDISPGQVERIRQALRFPSWLAETIERVPDDERPDLAQRIEEVFIQVLCGRKLHLALESGLAQENQEIPAHALTSELDRLTQHEREHILSALRAELDLDEPQFHSAS